MLNLEEDLTFLTDHKAWNEISLGELDLKVERSPGPRMLSHEILLRAAGHVEWGCIRATVWESLIQMATVQ